MIPKSTKSILSEFRMSRGQSEEVPKQVAPPSRDRKPTSTYYDMFLKKYNNLDETIDKLGTRELVYYFREIAQEQGYKYTISNIKKDMSIMKRLRNNYSNREICGMIEFLYESDQDYIEKDRLSPNILASSWVNTVYADMQLWVDDKYVPRSVQNKKKNNIKSKEWDKDVADIKDWRKKTVQKLNKIIGGVVMSKIEEELVENQLSPLAELLGTKRVEDLKDKICGKVLDQIETDLYDCHHYIFTTEDIREIALEALEDITPKIKKKFEKAYMEIVDKSIEELKSKSILEKEEQNETNKNINK